MPRFHELLGAPLRAVSLCVEWGRRTPSSFLLRGMGAPRAHGGVVALKDPENFARTSADGVSRGRQPVPAPPHLLVLTLPFPTPSSRAAHEDRAQPRFTGSQRSPKPLGRWPGLREAGRRAGSIMFPKPRLSQSLSVQWVVG